jgi:xanthine/uracil permease
MDGASDLIFGLEDRPPLRDTLLVALQHVLAMFVGIITPPLIIGGALKLSAGDTAYLVSMSLFVSGLATVVQTSRLGPVGSGLLSVQGTSFTFISPILAATGAVIARVAAHMRPWASSSASRLRGRRWSCSSVFSFNARAASLHRL